MVRSQQSTRPVRPLRAAWALLYAPLTAGSARKCRGADGSAWPALADLEPCHVSSTVCPGAVHLQRGEEPQICSLPHIPLNAPNLPCSSDR